MPKGKAGEKRAVRSKITAATGLNAQIVGQAALLPSISRFDCSGEYFASVLGPLGETSSVQIWNALRSEVVCEFPRKLLKKKADADQVTCLGWIAGNNLQPVPRLAIGFSNGTILVASIAEAEIHAALKVEGHTAAVTDVCAFTLDGSLVLGSCAKDARLLIWDLSTASVLKRSKQLQQCPERLVAHLVGSECSLLVASNKVERFDAKSLKQAMSWGASGHATPICSLSLDLKQSVLATCAINDRFCMVWNAATGDLLASVPLDTACIQGVVHASDRFVFALADSGVLSLIDTTTKKLARSLQFCTDAKARIPIHCLSGNTRGWDVVSVRGQLHSPIFERVSLEPSGEEQTFALRSDPQKSILAMQRTAHNREGEVSQVVDAKVATLGMADEPVAAISADVSFEERLMQLKVANGEQTVDSELSSTIPQPTSMAHLLQQALRSKDVRLLEDVLGSCSASMIDGTVRRLPPTAVPDLLFHIVARFQSTPNRGPFLLGWVRAILAHHLSFLISLGSIAPQLLSLYQTMQARLSNFDQLLSLNGKLELALSQVSSRAALNDLGEKARVPQFVFREDDVEQNFLDPQGESKNSTASDYEDFSQGEDSDEDMSAAEEYCEFESD